MMQDELKIHLKRLERRLFVSYTIALIALIGLSVVSNYIMKEQAARQATSLIRRNVVRDIREALYQLNEAELDYFDTVVYFDKDSLKLFSLPTGVDEKKILHPSLWSELVDSRIETTLYFDSQQKNKVASVIFVFNRFSEAPWAFLIWAIFLVSTIPIIRSTRIKLIENYNRDVTLREESTRATLARRVRHDIRSPLGALEIATQDLSGLPEAQAKLINQAIKRISEIVSELQLIRISAPAPTAITSGTPEVHSVMSAVEDIILEKRARLAFSKINITPNFSADAFFLFAKFHPAELKRSLSNILENAIEACEEGGQIGVLLHHDQQTINIEINDTGRGIAPVRMARVFDKGFTFGKTEENSGMGLFYAKKMVDDLGGTLSIQSELGRGTSIKIALPACSPPSWYTPKLEIPKAGTVVILDDQESSHLALRMRLNELTSSGATFTIEAFKRPEDLRAWLRTDPQRSSSNTVYLFDYDLGKNQPTGLDLLEELKLSANAYLITGHYDATDIQARCALLRVGLIPKTAVATLPFLPI